METNTENEICKKCKKHFRVPGFVMCAWCRREGRENSILYRTTEKGKQAQKRARHIKVIRHHVAGVCLSCSHPTEAGVVYCERHMSSQRERVNKRRRQAKDSGLCATCGVVEPENKHRVSCHSCNWKRLLRSARSRGTEYTGTCSTCGIVGHTSITCDVFLWAIQRGVYTPGRSLI